MCSTLLPAACLAALGSDDYFAREAASRVLAGLVRNSPGRHGPAISHNASLNPSAEVRSRCGRLCGPYNAHLADTYTPPTRRYPCCDWAVESGAFPDCAWDAWMECVPYDGQIKQASHPEWCRYRRATELYVRNQIRWGAWSWADADAAVRVAWDAELKRFVERYPEHVAAVEAWSRR